MCGLILAISLQIPVSTSAVFNIEDRIGAAIDFINGQRLMGSVGGFLRYTNTSNQRLIYSEDNGIIALALAGYQDTHYPYKFYSSLKSALEFIIQAQSPSRDFYEYYDVAAGSWFNAGKLYYWDSYVIMGAAYAAYVGSSKSADDISYWSKVVQRLRVCVDYWLPRRLTVGGSVSFSFPNSPDSPDIAASSAMLIGLIYLALQQYTWGDRGVASTYSAWSQAIASWIYNLQETNKASKAFGGFYSDATGKMQLSFENGLAMFAINKYYSAISLLTTKPAPSVEDSMQIMINWAEGFAERILDGWGGPQFGRSDGNIIKYPKEVKTASLILQALADVWINIGGPTIRQRGPPYYWSDAYNVYEWLVGENEFKVDLQRDRDIAGIAGGFVDGLSGSGQYSEGTITPTTWSIYALIRTSYISIPEFESVPILLPLLILLSLVATRRRQCRYPEANCRSF
jgi:hypothetical protein